MSLSEPTEPHVRLAWARQSLEHAITDLQSSVSHRLENAAYIHARDALQRLHTAEWLMRGYECPIDLLLYVRSKVSAALQNLPEASEGYRTAMAGVLADIDTERHKRAVSS